MRFFLDNNLPRELAGRLNGYDRESIRVEHLTDTFAPHTPDVEWVRSLAESQEPPFVVTRDRKMNKRIEEVRAIADGGLSVFFLMDPWPKYDIHNLTWRLFKAWPTIVNHALDAWGDDRPTVFVVEGEKIRPDVRRHRPR